MTDEEILDAVLDMQNIRMLLDLADVDVWVQKDGIGYRRRTSQSADHGYVSQSSSERTKTMDQDTPKPDGDPVNIYNENFGQPADKEDGSE